MKPIVVSESAMSKKIREAYVLFLATVLLGISALRFWFGGRSSTRDDITAN